MSRRALVLALLVAAACGDRRKPIAVRGDAGPSVVVVDPVKRNAQPVALVDEAEPDDDTAHAQPLEPGKGIRGTLGAPKTVRGKAVSDEDFYSWTEGGTPAPTALPPPPGSPPPPVAFNEARIELSGVPGLDLQLEALDGDGKRLWLANDAGPGEGEVIANLGVEPGHTYYLKVKATPPVAGGKPYELVVRSGPAPAGDEREPNDDAAHATPLQTIGDASGFYGRRRDEDWFVLPPGPPAGTLRIELTPVEGVVPQLRVLTGAPPGPLTVLADARAGRGEELRLRNVGVPASGNVYLALKAIEGRSPELRWSLKLNAEAPLEGAEHEPNDTVATATPVAFTGAARVSGFLWPGDVDVYRVAGAAPEGLVTVELEGLDRVDLKLERLGPDGKALVKADDGGPGKPEVLPPWPGGDLLIRVSARSRDTAFDAPYQLTITAAPAEPNLEREPNNSPATATPWGEGPTMRGYLAPRGDEDFFRFTAPAGKSKATVEVSGGAIARVLEESRAPLIGPLQTAKSYLVNVKAANDKSSNAKDPYTVTLKLE